MTDEISVPFKTMHSLQLFLNIFLFYIKVNTKSYKWTVHISKLSTKHQTVLCFFLAVDCMTPTISNSRSITLNSGTVFGDTATVNCTPGYTGSGSTGVITCGSDATWGGFTCTGKILI